MSILELRNITLKYSTMKKPAVDNLSLSMKTREIHALVGESGCGKSSTIRMIAGLELPVSGEIYYGDELINKPGYSVPPESREIGMVFQDYALFPHLTVKKNILFGVKDKKEHTDERVDYFLNLTGLGGLGDRYPHEISGGQMQRVALARALAPEPDLILMDEPFNNLDIRIKRNMLEEVGNILRKTGTSCLFITHEKEEAFILADRISVMRDGRLLQTAFPLELYRYPVDTYVAEFFGRANHIPVKKQGDSFVSPLGKIEITEDMKNGTIADEGFLVHRPWDIEISPHGQYKAIITDSYFFGDYQEVWFETSEETMTNHFKFFTHINKKFSRGENFRFNIPVERLTFCRE